MCCGEDVVVADYCEAFQFICGWKVSDRTLEYQVYQAQFAVAVEIRKVELDKVLLP